MTKPRLILICGAWGSGTSVVAKIVEHIGISTDTPCLKINDPKTIDSYESIRFREVVQEIIDEKTLKVKVNSDEIKKILLNYKNTLSEDFYNGNINKPLYLKYPLASLIIDQLRDFFDIVLIYVLRPIKDIESSRIRRGWSNKYLGGEGAKLIYGRLFEILLNQSVPTILIKYDELIKNPEIIIRQIISISGQNKTQDEINRLIKLVKKND